MTTKVKATIEAATLLLKAAYRWPAPQGIGKRLKFDKRGMSKIEDGQGALVDALRPHAPLFVKGLRHILVGPEDKYIEIRTPEEKTKAIKAGKAEVDMDVSYRCIDLSHEIEFELNGLAKRGLYYVLLRWLHQDDPEHLAPGRQVEVAWPLARQLPDILQQLCADSERQLPDHGAGTDDDWLVVCAETQEVAAK